MNDQRYHHGNLREALLAEAARMLKEQGNVDRLSLRDLARRTGVSHAAHRRHFADRQALLDAIAERGFTEIGATMEEAVAGAGDDVEAALQSIATAYVRFAIGNPALLELMFAGKRERSPDRLYESATRMFTTVGDLIDRAQRGGVLSPGDPERIRLLIVAFLQGIAALAVSGRVRTDQVDGLVLDAVALFMMR